MSSSISDPVEDQFTSTFPTSWPQVPPGSLGTPDNASLQSKRLRLAIPSPTPSPTSSDGSSSGSEDTGYPVFPSPRTPSPRPRRFAPDRKPHLLTPPDSEDDGDALPSIESPHALDLGPAMGTAPSSTPARSRGRGKDRHVHIAGRPVWSMSASPDRFINNRFTPQDSTKTFRLSKSPQLLSEVERLVRQDHATPDPFVQGSPRRARRGRSLVTSSESRAIGIPPQRSPSGPDMLQVPRHSPATFQTRQASAGAVWNVGGGINHPTGPIEGVSDGRGGLFGRGTNAPLYTAKFLDASCSEEDVDIYENRLAIALDINRTNRVLDFSRLSYQGTRLSGTKRKLSDLPQRTRWKYGEWSREGDVSPMRKMPKKERKPVPTIPFRVLDAPQLRDDYYCSVLAYCDTNRTLAVGLSNKVYLWSEANGVQYPKIDEEIQRRESHVTSLSFSSTEGGHCILAIGRNSGHITLWSLYEEGSRFESQQPGSVACLAFKPVSTRRVSERFETVVLTEELLVGDDLGNIYYYTIEWVDNLKVDIHGWSGTMHLLAKIDVHSQQICGLAWSPDGSYFATGANDNACCLFVVKDILTPIKVSRHDRRTHRRPLQPLVASLTNVFPSTLAKQRVNSFVGSVDIDPISLAQRNVSNPYVFRAIPGAHGTLSIGEGRQKYKWIHSAAIKAIAFCPWQPGLIATGGGSNDRAIHFYHTSSGACLATINVYAQVTSLIWSTSRHEIAATFGYAQPEHPYRIAVFSWPACRQVVAIPWSAELRALHAIPYPGGPNEAGRRADEGEAWWSRTAEEGCIVVACSDESVKFHEVWTGKKKSMGLAAGLLGGSDILEAFEGFDKEGSLVFR